MIVYLAYNKLIEWRENAHLFAITLQIFTFNEHCNNIQAIPHLVLNM